MVLFIYMMINTKHKVKLIFQIASFFILGTCLFSQTEVDSKTLETVNFSTLLENYKKNNRDYQKLELQLQQSSISYQESLIENGLNLSLSSGNINAEFDDSTTKMNFSPEVKLSSSSLNNSSLSMSLPFSFDISDYGVSSKEIKGASVMLSTDLISNVSKQKKLSLEKANRNVIEAQRNLKNGETKIYSTFLKELRELYSSSLSVIQSENSLIEKQLDFDTVKAKGYSTGSAKYRTASLEVESAKRTVKEKERLYKSSLAIFAAKCSVKPSQINLNFEIPETSLVSIREYKKDDFTELEKANWNYQMNSASRNLNSDFSLSAQGGYGFSVNEDGFSDSAKAGLSLNYKGISVSATTAIPINQNSNPSVSLGIGWNPSSSKINNLSAKSSQIQDEIERLGIKDAQENFFDTVLSMEEKRSNLQWETEQNIEQLELYQELENDMTVWYKKGIVSESEYRQAKINCENAKVKLALVKIDRILYNNDLSLLFVEKTGENANENTKEN